MNKCYHTRVDNIRRWIEGAGGRVGWGYYEGEGFDMHNSEVFLLHISICIFIFTMSSICINLRCRFAY